MAKMIKILSLFYSLQITSEVQEISKIFTGSLMYPLNLNQGNLYYPYAFPALGWGTISVTVSLTFCLESS